ncbi:MULTISPECIES: 3-oxoadipate enol-lactonase [Burkholderiaceae]|uniref:3-oxoadipate enol-lactonase n=1 Tax=Burkholderiaceae TaxID=119060 RepID=UPI000961D804|nr:MULTISPECIES: 3-oxoadipate enol-lactonase [Burkholderiaceae]MCG1039206.1 3-oxoadipate enol-lactonase [Mycetohabitans sp. B7]SIT67836.1 3-oxoadipate enol-lactonase [Burkholderia sp. b14]
MPFASIDGIHLHYRIDGAEHTDAPWVVLSHSLGTRLAMWDAQVVALSAHFRVLRYDTRGHGQSDTPPGPYTIGRLADDVVALLDTLGIERAHFCGLSMGGQTGIALGACHGDRLIRLVLSNTAFKIGSPQVWNSRIAKARGEGMAGLADAIIERWLTPGFRERQAAQAELLRAQLVATDHDGYAANCEAVRDAHLRDALGRITVPTLVIAGTHDVVTSPEQGRAMAAAIQGAQYLELDASHISNIEQRDAYNRELVAFLRSAA